jgi:HK97 family phage prohead protease
MTPTTRTLDVQVRAVADTTGEITGRDFAGIGVPYNETISLGPGLYERFEPGAIDLDRDDLPTLVLWRHDEPIGRVTSGRDTDDGFEITCHLSDTERGTEAATLLRDGVITRMSIGFKPDQYRIETDPDTGAETIIHTRVRALEFSLVPFPAYSAATVTDVRHHTTKENPMGPDTLTRADLDPIETSLQDLERQIALLENTHRHDEPAAPRFRSIGAYLKAVASGDEDALTFHRDFTGQTTAGQIKNETFLGAFIKFVQDRRRLINLFDRGSLPAKGMSVEYAQMTEETLKAGKQETEGTDLAGPGKVTLTTKSTPVDTYGGWTELTRQVIERSELPYLDTVMKTLGLKYAKATNDAMRTTIKKTIKDQESKAITLTGADAATIYDWRDVIIDAASRYDDNGFVLEGMLVSLDVFKRLQRLEYTHIPALTVHHDEFSGTLDLPGGQGDLARVPVHCLFGEVADNTVAFYDSSAIKTLESPNAPLQLQDDNIINLSRSFSLYGYLSVITPFPNAIVPVKVTA